MALTAEVFDAAAEPAPAEWDRFVRREGMTPAWRAGALAALAVRPRTRWLGMVQEGGQVAAVGCGQHYGPATARGPLAGLLECRLPVGTCPGLAFAKALTAPERRAALVAFERAMFRRLGWSCLGIAHRHVPPADLSVYAGGARLRLATAPDLRIDNRWTTMEEYFASLPAHRRRRLRYMYRKLGRDPELKIGIGPTGVAGAEASRLAWLTRWRHRRRPTAPPPVYFEALAGQAGVLFLSYRDRGDQLLGFGLVFDDGSGLHSAIWGSLDPHGDGRPHLYFDHYLRLIQYMIEQRRERTFFGKGMAEVKQSFGCTAVPQFAVVVPR
jgi:hypothetical protein